MMDRTSESFIVRAFNCLPFFNLNYNLLYNFILSIIFFTFYFIISKLLSHNISLDEKYAMLIVVAFTSSAYTLYFHSYKLINNLSEKIETLFYDESQIIKYYRHKSFILYDNRQLIPGIIFSFILLSFVKWLEPGLSFFPSVVFYFFVFISGVVCGVGLWIVFTFILWVINLRKYGRLNTYIVPCNTYAIKSLSELIGIITLAFALQYLLGVIALFTVGWENSNIIPIVVDCLILPLLTVNILLFVIPQLAVNKIISDAKTRDLINIEKLIKKYISYGKYEFINNENKDVDNYKFLMDTHDKILNSPDSALDTQTIFRFITSIIIPLLIYLKDFGLVEFLIKSF